MNYRDRTIKNEDIILDNAEITGCTFVGCRLIFRGTAQPRVISANVFDGCSWQFEGAARETMTFLRLMYGAFGEWGQGSVESAFNEIRQGLK